MSSLPSENARAGAVDGKRSSNRCGRASSGPACGALMRKQIPVSAYTKPGDLLRIDCGYRPNGVVRLFQAVSLEADAEAAKVLAFSAQAIAQGVARVENATLELTAIIEPIRRSETEELDEDRIAQYRFAVEAMEEHAIRVLTTSDLSRVAEAARRELHV